MARSEDNKKEGKRGPSAAKEDGARKKESRAKAAPRATPSSAPRKKAAAPRARKNGSAEVSAPSTQARGASPASKPAARARAKSTAPASAKPAPRAGAKRASPAGAKPAAKAAAAKPTAARPAAPRKRAPSKKAEASRVTPVAPALDEEERIEDAKYLPRELSPRLFEEERFIFPDSYGQSRIRLLVKDPDWLFAHWDVDPQSLADLRAELGERASALSSLTLRVVDPRHGGESRVLLPDGARSWYVRADRVQRSYRAELGLTLPSGEFRALAESNTVTTPRSGPSRAGGPRRVRYDGAVPRGVAAGPTPVAGPADAPPAPDPGPWHPDPSAPPHPDSGGRPDRPGEGRSRLGEPSGGASDVYRR